MDHFHLTIAGAALLIGTSASATLPIAKNDGCLDGPMAQFGQYLGNWHIADSQLAADGSAWTDGAGARWDWVCLGDGTAIQDYWMPTGGNVGTNLRMWNSETNTWDIAWMYKGMKGFAHITAEHDVQNGNTVLLYKSPIPNPMRRITFFPATADGWKWKMEQSTDEGQSWREVYRIVATPWKEKPPES